MCVSTMLVHVHCHLHSEMPPIEPYMVTTLPFKNHVIETLTPTCVLRACAFQLAGVFTDIFNLSLSLSVVPL